MAKRLYLDHDLSTRRGPPRLNMYTQNPRHDIVLPALPRLNEALVHNRRPRNRVLRQPLVDINLNSGIRRTIRPRDRNASRKLPTTPTRNLDLL